MHKTIANEQENSTKIPLRIILIHYIGSLLSCASLITINTVNISHLCSLHSPENKNHVFVFHKKFLFLMFMAHV